MNAAVPPTVSWLFRESAVQNYSLALNTGSTLVLGCSGRSTWNTQSAGSAAFVLTKGSAVSSLTLTTATASLSTPPPSETPGTPFTFAASGGTLIWDNVNGHTNGNDNFIISSSLPISNMPATGYMQLYLPFVRTTESGLYYCTFFDGSAANTAGAPNTFTSTTFFSLTVHTLSGSSSPKSVSKNKALDYSLILLETTKILF